MIDSQKSKTKTKYRNPYYIRLKQCLNCGCLRETLDFYVYNNRTTDWCIFCIIDHSEKRYLSKYNEYIIQLKYQIDNPKETNFLNYDEYPKRNNGKRMSKPGFLNIDINGICTICGEPIFFGVAHHILGDQSNFTVMLCSDCHLTDGNTQIKYHCKVLGGRIEFGALCWS